MTEKELIVRLKLLDQDAFRELVARFEDPVVNICYRLINQEEDARDVAQEVFVEVFYSIRHFREDAALGTWIFRIAVNKSIDFIRKKNRKKRVAILQTITGIGVSDQKTMAQTVSTPLMKLEQKEKEKLVRQALGKIPENQRIAWTLHKMEGLSQAEVANVMGTTIPAVESLVYRARKTLFSILSEQLK